MQKIDSGAEALIFKDKDQIIKDRVSKSYRHPEIDNSIRKFRTRREAKVLKRLEEINFPAPKLKQLDDKNMKINMELINGKKLKNVLHKDPEKLSKEIGKKIALLHNADIIHSDLTTSNMILDDEIYFIDFGLSFFSKKPEDKAVDLHLLGRAFDSKHHKISNICWKSALDSYKETADNAEEILTRLERVEKRGRNKLRN